MTSSTSRANYNQAANIVAWLLGVSVANDSSATDGLEVSSALEALRAELEQTWRSGAGHQVQFGIDEITLTLTVVATGKKAGGGKIRWYVVEAGGELSHENSATQTLVLKLQPKAVDPRTGQTWPLQVGGNEPKPPG